LEIINNLHDFFEQIPDRILQLGGRAILALIIFLIGVQLIRLLRKIIKRALRKGKADTGLIQFLDSFIKIALYILMISSIASWLGLDATSVAAVIGTAGVAIGLAVQGSLSNVAGGVLIIMLKPFKVGDYIKEDRFGNEGTVDEIDLIYTKLKTPDNKVIVLPNGTLANTSMTNATACQERRLDIRLTVSPDTDVAIALAVLSQVLEAEEKVLRDKEYRVFVDELVFGGVVLAMRCWLKAEDFWTTKWRLSEKIKIAIDTAGIKLATNQNKI
jgi:small conductance mechanosensitive channel